MLSPVLIASDHLYLAGGIILIGLVAVQMAFWVGSSFTSFVSRQKQFKLSLAILEQKLATAKAAKSVAHPEGSWQGLRNLVVAKLERETENVLSIYLEPQDHRKLPYFQPGQYLTFVVDLPGESKPQTRCYSLSHAPNHEYYRCTIKQLEYSDPAKQSRSVSNYFNSNLKVGDVLKTKSPAGSFFLELGEERPVILLAAGIGVTPIFSMLESVSRFQPHRRVVLFYGVQNSQQHPLKNEIKAIASRNRNIHVVTCYSNPLENDRPGIDFDQSGRVSLDLLRSTLPSANFRFMLCGPGLFMSDLVEGLREWGVHENNIHFEAFGPASVKRIKNPEVESTDPESGQPRICFARSNQSIDWKAEYESILEAAEANGIQLDSGCRAGNCGTCELGLKKGEVSYSKSFGVTPEDGKILSCVARPVGETEVDA